MYDFSDNLVRALVEATHLPAEIPSGDPKDGVLTLALVCQKDLAPWPCAAVTQLRTFAASQRANVPIPTGVAVPVSTSRRFRGPTAI